MTLIVPAVLGGLALTVMALVSILAARKGKHPAAGHHGEVKQAAILVHAINDDRCTGCDACVAVCPTNVLDLVHNKSRVVRFQDCIQCEACMWACPTTALVMHLEGSTPPRLKVPELDDSFQTAVPGQYLIGEVAGKPLVKNAANLGRVVVEHMLRTGMQPGALASMGPTAVDVLIVGSGPGGLSAALTCIHRGLSYVVLEKEQLVASTISRYPKGKLVMAEPYDVRNLSLLPVFDSSKEQLIPIWEALMQRTNMNIHRGETVEAVKRGPDGVFEVRTTVASYQAQRVVLATGTRGKPRTLGVPGESLPKIRFLLEDPDEFRGQPVIVVGGGDSAVEAAIALADAGAKVVLSYRGRSFNRAQPKNKQTIESYAAQHRVKVRYQSNIIEFTQDTVTLELANGQRKTYPNLVGFMLIGSDPPVKWLEKLGVHFVERPHEYALGKTDELVMRFLGDAVPCPENADAAASLVLTGHVPADMSIAASAPTMVPAQAGVFDPISEISASQPQQQRGSGPRKWLRSATALFTSTRKLEQPIPLSEFAKRSSSQQRHSGDGRRDALPAAERTRILRMLRDEGGRIADEESRADILAAPRSPFDGEDDSGPVFLSPAPTPAAGHAQGAGPGHAQNAAFSPGPAASSTTPALVVGLNRATAQGSTSWRARPSQPPPAARGDEPTIASDSDGALAQLLRSSAHRQMSLAADADLELGDDEATRAITIDSRRPSRSEDATRHARTQDERRQQGRPESPRRAADMGSPGGDRNAASSLADEEEDATHAVDMSELAQRGFGRPSLPDPRLAGRDPRAMSRDPRVASRDPRFVEPAPQFDDEATHAVDLNSMHQQAPPRSLTDVDWDLD